MPKKQNNSPALSGSVAEEFAKIIALGLRTQHEISERKQREDMWAREEERVNAIYAGFPSKDLIELWDNLLEDEYDVDDLWWELNYRGLGDMCTI